MAFGINDNGGAFFTGSVHVGAVNGFGLYQALLTQTSTSAPVATVLYSNLSGTVTWTRTSAGLYVGTLVAEFTASKTGILITGDTGAPQGIITAKRVSADAINVKTWDSTAGTPAVADALLTGAYIQIIIAP